MVRRGNGPLIPGDFFGCECDLLPGLKLDRSGTDFTDADLWPLKIQDHADWLAGRLPGFPQMAECPQVLGMCAVRKIYPGNIHPGTDHGSECFGGSGRRAERTNYFCFCKKPCQGCHTSFGRSGRMMNG